MQVKSVLDICAQESTVVNRGFCSMADEMDAQGWPLVHVPGNRYFQLDPLFSGYAFCECIYRKLKGRVRVFDRELGIPLENLVKKMLTDKGIPYATGHYGDAQGQDWQCDLILEGTDSILFIEVKKRPLPREFQQGDNVEIFHALAEGMVYGQLQALRHRAALVKNGELKLYTDSTYENQCAAISYGRRRIYTMSVCLPEYAFFTTAVVAQKIFYLLYGSITAVDPAMERRLDKFNRFAAEFCTLFHDSGSTDLRQFLHCSVFRSLHQLWTVAKLCDAGDIDRFIGLLTCDCVTSTYNLDYYHSLYCALELGK